MFRCHSIIWISILWSLIFSYTVMTHFEISHIARTSVLGTSIVFIVLGSTLLIYEKVAKYTKILLWFSSWTVAILLGLVLFTENDISDLTLNLWITAASFLASVFWCALSHADRITEAGLHWYVWSLISIVIVSSAFNNTSHIAIIMHIIMCAVLVIINIIYLMYTYTYQTENERRCRQLWRITSCFGISVGLLIGSILFKSDILARNTWSEYIMGIQIVALVVIIVDSVIGFSHDHTYKGLEQLPEANDV